MTYSLMKLTPSTRHFKVAIVGNRHTRIAIDLFQQTQGSMFERQDNRSMIPLNLLTQKSVLKKYDSFAHDLGKAIKKKIKQSKAITRQKI